MKQKVVAKVEFLASNSERAIELIRLLERSANRHFTGTPSDEQIALLRVLAESTVKHGQFTES